VTINQVQNVTESEKTHVIVSSKAVYKALSTQKQCLKKNKSHRLRPATAHEARIQATRSHSVLLAEPGNESLQTKPVAAVRRGTVPMRVSTLSQRQKRVELTFVDPYTNNTP
jgi:hypothetical protein